MAVQIIDFPSDQYGYMRKLNSELCLALNSASMNAAVADSLEETLIFTMKQLKGKVKDEREKHLAHVAKLNGVELPAKKGK